MFPVNHINVLRDFFVLWFLFVAITARKISIFINMILAMDKVI